MFQSHTESSTSFSYVTEKVFPCFIFQVSLPLTFCDLSVISIAENYTFSLPGTSINQSTMGLVSLPILLIFKSIPQHREKIWKVPMLPFSPQKTLTISILLIFLFKCAFQKCPWTDSLFCQKNAELSKPGKVEHLWQYCITPMWQMSSLLVYKAWMPCRIHECHGKNKIYVSV